MELVNPIYPMRAIIRCKAKQRLMTNLDGSGAAAPFDEALFRELAVTLFGASQWDCLYEPCQTQADAAAIEDLASLELAASYRRIVQQQQHPLIQQLNALL